MNYNSILEQIKCYQPHSEEFKYENLQQENSKLVITQNYIYFGQYLNNLRHGKGILLQQNGRKYEGYWKEDHKSGYGWELLGNGSEYEGYFVLGKPHGKGKYTWPNGEYYDGEWMQGVKEGEGRWQGLGGDYYTGEWRNGKVDGYGEHVWKSGDRYIGYFQEWLKHGEGEEHFVNGDVYQGNYLIGKPHGYGEYRWANGATFQGYFKDGLRCGKGIWKLKNEGPTDIYQGDYENDKKNGYGIYKWANGNEYRGQFIDDFKHGYGEMHYQDGTEIKGNWEFGKITQEIKSNIISKRKSTQYENNQKMNNFMKNSNIQQKGNNNFTQNCVFQTSNDGISQYQNQIELKEIDKKNQNQGQSQIANNQNSKITNINPPSSQTARTQKTIRIRQCSRDKSHSMSQQSSQCGPSSPKREVSEKSDKLKTRQKFCVKPPINQCILSLKRPKAKFQFSQ